MSETTSRPIQQILNDLVKNIGSKENCKNSITELENKLKKYEDNDFNKFIKWLEKDSENNNKILRSLSDDPESYAKFKDMNSILIEYDKKQGVTDAIDTKKSMSARFLVTIGTFDQKKQEEIDKKNQEIDRKAQNIIDGIQTIKKDNGVYSYEMAKYIKDTFDIKNNNASEDDNKKGVGKKGAGKNGDNEKVDKEAISRFCDKFNNLKQTSWTPEEHHGFKMGLFNQNGSLFSDDFVKLETDAARIVRNENEGDFEFVKRSSLAIIDTNKLTMFVLNLNNGCDEKTICKQRTLNQMKPIIEGQIENIFKQGKDIKLSLGEKKEVCNEIVEDVINSFRDNVNVQGVAQSSDGLDIDLEDKQQILSGYVELLYEQTQKMEMQKQLEALGKELNKIKENYGKNKELTLTQKEQIEKYRQQFSKLQAALEHSNPEIETPAGSPASSVINSQSVSDQNGDLNVNSSKGPNANELDVTVDGVIGLIEGLQEQVNNMQQQLADKTKQFEEKLAAERQKNTEQEETIVKQKQELEVAQNKNDELTNKNWELEKDNAAMKKTMGFLQEDVNKLKTEKEAAENERDDNREKFRQQSDIDDKRIRILTEENDRLREQLQLKQADKEQKINDLVVENDELIKTNTEQTQRIDELTGENDTLKRELGTAQDDNTKLNQQIRDAQQKLKTEQDGRAQAEADKLQLQGRVDELTKTNEGQAETIKSQTDQIIHLNENYQGLDQNLQQVVLERNSVVAQNVALGKQNQQLQIQLEKQKGDYIRQIQQRDKTIEDLQNDVANEKEARLKAVGESDELRAKLVQSEKLIETLQNSRDRSLERAQNARDANEELARENRFQRGQIEELQQKFEAERQKNKELEATKAANQAMKQAVRYFLSNKKTKKSINTSINNLMNAIGDNVVNCDTDTLEYCLDRLEGKMQLNDSLNNVYGKLKAASKIEIDDETKTKKLGVLDEFKQKLEEQEKNQNTGKYNSDEIYKTVKGYCKNPEAEEQLINSIQNHIGKCGVNGLKTALEPLKNIGGLKQDQYKNLIEGLNGIAETISKEKKETIYGVVLSLKEKQLQQVQQELAGVRELLKTTQITSAEQAETIETQKKQLQDQIALYQQEKQALETATEQLKEQRKKIEAQQEEIDRQREKIAAQEQALTQAEEVRKQLQNQLTEKQEEIKGLNTQLNASDAKIQKLTSDIKGINDEKTKLAEQGRELEERINALNDTIEQNEKQNKETLEKKQGEINNLKSDLASEQEKISGLEAINSRNNKTLADQQRELNELKKQLATNQEAQRKKDEESQRLLREKEQLAKDKESLEDQLRNRQTEIDTLTEQNNAQGQKVDELEASIKNLNQQYTQQSEQLQQQLTEQKQTYEQRIDTLTEQNQQQIEEQQRLAAENAQKAEAYEQRINTLTEQNNERGQQVTALQENINKLKTDAQNAEDAHKQELQRREQEAAENAQNAKAEYQNKIAELTRQHRQNRQELLRKNRRLQQQIEQNEEQKQTYEQQIKGLKTENNNLADKIGNQRQELNRNGKKFEELKTKLQQTEDMAANAQQENTELRNSNTAMMMFLTSKSMQYEQQSKQLAAKEERLKEVGAALKQAQKERDAAAEAAARAEAANEEQKQTYERQAQDAEAEYQNKIKELREQITQLQKERDANVATKNQLQKQNKEQKQALEQAQKAAARAEAEKVMAQQMATLARDNAQQEIKELNQTHKEKIEKLRRHLDKSALASQGLAQQIVDLEKEVQQAREREQKWQMRTQAAIDLAQNQFGKQLAKQNAQNEKLKEEIKKYQDQEIEGFFANVNEIQEQAEKAAKTIKLKVGNDEFSVELSDIKLDDKELSGEELATSLKETFKVKENEPVEVANIFKQANEYVDGLEEGENLKKGENYEKLGKLCNVLNGLSGDNTKLKIAVMRDETTLKGFVAFNSNLKGKCGEDSDIYQDFRKALLKEFTIIKEIVNGMKNANILDMEFVKGNTVDKEVQAETIQNEVGAVQTEESGTQIENATPANSTDDNEVEVSTLNAVRVQRNKNTVEKGDKNVEKQSAQLTPTASQANTTAILDMKADKVVNTKENSNQQDSTAQKLSAQEQLKQGLNQTMPENNSTEKSETFVYYKYIQKKEGKEEDIGLKTELGKGDVKDVTFPIELQIESKKATLGEVVAYAKSVLESNGQEVNPDNVMKMLDLQGQGIGEDQLKAAKVSIANEINKFASEGVGLTEEKLREEANKNQSYSQVVDRIAKRAEQIAQLKNGKLGDRIANTVRENAPRGGYAQREMEREEERLRQPASLQK